MKTIINKEYIKSLNPCESGYKNYLKHHSDFSGNVLDFLKLDNISYSDKIWVIIRLDLDDMVYKRWSLACASSQLSNTTDIRVGECLEVVERYLNGNINKNELFAPMSAAESAAMSARSAAESAARSAARSTQEEVNILLLIDVIEDYYEV